MLQHFSKCHQQPFYMKNAVAYGKLIFKLKIGLITKKSVAILIFPQFIIISETHILKVVGFQNSLPPKELLN